MVCESCIFNKSNICTNPVILLFLSARDDGQGKGLKLDNSNSNDPCVFYVTKYITVSQVYLN